MILVCVLNVANCVAFHFGLQADKSGPEAKSLCEKKYFNEVTITQVPNCLSITYSTVAKKKNSMV
jgi:hypothetical protein